MALPCNGYKLNLLTSASMFHMALNWKNALNFRMLLCLFFGETSETKKQHISVNFELWYKCKYSIQYSFQQGIRWFNQIFSILNYYVTVWGPIWHKNSKKWPKIGIWIIEGKIFPCTSGAVWFCDPVTLRVPDYKKGAFLHISTRFSVSLSLKNFFQK